MNVCLFFPKYRGVMLAVCFVSLGSFRLNANGFDPANVGMIDDIKLLGEQAPTSFETLPASARLGFGGTRTGSTDAFENLTLLAGIEGSKQPQDYGVNATLGGRFEVNWATPVYEPLGIGLQLGTATVASDNAVEVFELLGEEAHRYQQYVTVGAFQRCDNGLSFGVVYDFLYQESYDTVTLGQWRSRVSMRPWESTEIGVTAHLRSFGDEAAFGAGSVQLRTINQASIYLRRFYSTSVQGTLWLGVADEHSEANLIASPRRATDEAFVMGADLLAPLSKNLAVYGETNLMMPADTGTVDAFMALVWYPSGNAKLARRTRYSPLLPVAASTSFSVDLLP